MVICFDVNYRDCVEWLSLEIDMRSSSAPQFIAHWFQFYFFLSPSLYFCFRCSLSTHYHYITVKSVMWESRSRALLSFFFAAIERRFERNQRQHRHNQFNDRSIRVVFILWYFALRLFHLLLLLLLLYRDRMLRWIVVVVRVRARLLKYCRVSTIVIPIRLQ